MFREIGQYILNVRLVKKKIQAESQGVEGNYHLWYYMENFGVRPISIEGFTEEAVIIIND